jgi:hypothetical protein
VPQLIGRKEDKAQFRRFNPHAAPGPTFHIQTRYITFKMLKIKFDTTDDNGFTETVKAIITNLILSLNPNEISIVRIKNWFDNKWLNYSGKEIRKYDTGKGAMIPFVLEPFWNKEITIPPFTPNRVLNEAFYRLKGKENPKFEELTHIWQHSTDNKKRLISERTENGLCIWISSNSVANGQGSLMVYQIKNSEILTWYVNIENKNGWKITKAKGIDKNNSLLYVHKNVL